MANTQDLEPLLNTQQNQLSVLLSEGSSIDSKALAILASNVAILIFISQTAPSLPLWQYFVLYTPFVLSLGLDIISIWPRPYRGPGIPSSRLKDYLNLSSRDLLLQLLSNTQKAISHNTRLNRQRSMTCLWSIVLTSLGFLPILVIL
jgi:hypothetical protein